MRRLLLSLIFTLLAVAGVQAQTTNVSGTVTDTAGQVWANGTYTFRSGSPQEPVITGTLSSGGAFTSVPLPHDQFTASVNDAWTLSFCPDVSIPSAGQGCYNVNITALGADQTVSGLSPPPPALTIPLYPGAIGTIRAYNDAEIVSTPKGGTYFNVLTLVERLCTAIGGTPTLPTCTTWVNNGGGSGPGGTVTFNQILNPNANTFLNFGGTNAQFINGTFDFTNFNLLLPSSPTFVPSTSSTLGINTTVNNLRVWNGVEAAEIPSAPMANSYTDGDLFGISIVGGHLTMVDKAVNASSGPSFLNVEITNPQVNDSFCIDSIGPPVHVVNCTEGVPITTITGTSYAIDCNADRGSYLLFTSTSPISVTIPQASPSGTCSANFFTYLRTLSADLTITPTVSTIDDGGGAGASTTIHAGYGTNVFSDDTNYLAKVSPYRENPNPMYNAEGYDIGTAGRFQWQEPNGSPATVLNKMVCLNGSSLGIICPAASSTTNNPDGVAVRGIQANAGSTGNVGVANFGFIPVVFDNSATAGHFAQLSPTVDGDLHDVGTSKPTNGQAWWRVWTTNSGAGTTSVVRIVTAEETAAAGGNGNGKTSVLVNGVQTKPQANLQNGGGCTFTGADSGNTTNINVACAAGGVTSFTGDQVVHNNSASTGAVTESLKLQSPNTVLAGPVSSGLSNVVQSVTGRCGPNVGACTGGTQLSVAINNVASGHALIAVVKWQGSGVPTTSGDTFALAHNSGTGYLNTNVYVVCSSTGGNKTVTTAAGSVNVPIIMHLYEVVGMKTTACTDTTGDAAAPGGDPTHVTVSTGGSVAQASEFVLFVASNGGAGPFPVFSSTFGPGYTELNETLDGADFQSFSLTTGIGNSNTGLSGVQTGTATLDSASGANLAGIIATFKLDTPASSATPTFRALVTADLPSPFNGIPNGSTFNVSPVTVNANSTADQNLQALIIPAGFFNSLGKTLRVFDAGVYSTPVASTATLTYKLKLCTVSGCGSGTVVTLASWTTSANPGNVTTNPWNTDVTLITQTTGTSGAFESHGNLVIDLGATAGLADSIFSDTNTATTGTIDLSQLLYLQATVSFSAASASNTCVHRLMSAPNMF